MGIAVIAQHIWRCCVSRIANPTYCWRCITANPGEPFILPRTLTQYCVTLIAAFYKQCVYQSGETEGVS
jgi:hypothetical protein